MHRPQRFNRQQIQLQPIIDRGHGLSCNQCIPLNAPGNRLQESDIDQVAELLLTARQNNRSTILMTGAHPIKLGLSRFLIDLIERRLITHVATNGAGIIHDFELALVYGTLPGWSVHVSMDGTRSPATKRSNITGRRPAMMIPSCSHNSSNPAASIR